MKQMLGWVMFVGVLVSGLETAALAACNQITEQKCHQVCQNGNCRNECFPETHTVCDNNDTPRSIQPAGGILKDSGGKATGAWGGVTIPAK